MSLEVRQLVLRASVQDDTDDGDDKEGSASKENTSCGGGDADPCEEKETLKEELLAACRLLVREELRALRER